MSATYASHLRRLKGEIHSCDPEAAKLRMEKDKDLQVLDVREGEEVRAGLIPGAVHISRSFLEMRAESVLTRKDTPILVYCAGGIRSLFAAQTLLGLGYQQVTSLDGGFNAWKSKGYEVSIPPTLNERDRQRYMRHLTIPEVGEGGQLKLLNAKVLMIGAGGLGSPAAYYLAAAGVGTLGIVDNDVVEISNLQRQILHNDARIGTAKVDSAAKTLREFNPDIEIQTFKQRLTADNVEDLFSEFDLIVDGTDNFPTRYLINDACVKLGLPCVHGSVFRFEGQVTVFHAAAGGPCYRCLFPEPPPPEMAPSCAEAGVLGVLPGVMGILEAVETIKILLGVGDPLVGRILQYEALSGTFREFKASKDPDCLYCDPKKSFPGYVDYAFFCSSKGP